ncbi:MAG TPA: orotate phosphoribosyltransferase [Methanocorpusculum sp.]|nr:orotate phosphoribosyltransferase [Methanocorpusculum sp.]
MENKVLDLLIQYNAVEFGDFTLASGIKSPYYIDVKTAIINHPNLLNQIAKNIVDKYNFDVIAGVVVGGVPLAVAVSLESHKPCAIIRSTMKDHGKQQIVIGNVTGKHVLLVEDVTTSGQSSLYGVNELRNQGAIVDDVVVIVDRECGAEKLLASEGINLHSLVKSSELLKNK